MRAANLNPLGLVFSILPVRLATDPDFDPQIHYTPERIAERIAAGEHIVMIADNVPDPPYGHRYDEVKAQFVPDPTWLADTISQLDAAVAALTTEAQMAAKFEARLRALPPESVHPAEITAAASDTARATAEAAKAQADADALRLQSQAVMADAATVA